MGYSMATDGSVVLPAEAEPDALAAAAGAMAPLQGWYPDDNGPPDDSLQGLARYVGATLTRDGDELRFTTDRHGDPKWSDQATAFYLALAPHVRSGEVRFKGEDGQAWRYRYHHGTLRQDGTNGWDLSSEPFGPPAELADQPPPDLRVDPQLRHATGRGRGPRPQAGERQDASDRLGLSPTAVGLIIGATVLLILLLSL